MKGARKWTRFNAAWFAGAGNAEFCGDGYRLSGYKENNAE